MRAYTHGGWAHRQRVSTTFLTRKNSQLFLELRTGFEPLVFGSRVDALDLQLLLQALSVPNL